MSRLKYLAMALMPMLFANPAHASLIYFHDDFSTYGENTVLNAPSLFFGGNWSVSGGTIDYLASGSAYGDLCQNTGNCIDLDGSTRKAGLFSSSVFDAGSYQLNLDILGSGRDSIESLTVSLGNWNTTLNNIGPNDRVTRSFSFETTGGALMFQNSGNDKVGAILTQVTLSAPLEVIPLPAGMLLMTTGLGAIGFLCVVRRRTNKSTV